jgi:heat shock protein HtpX
MSLTFENLIAHNKRVSLVLVLGLVVFTAMVGGLFGTVYGGGSQSAIAGILPFGALVGAGVAIGGALISYAVGNRIILGLAGATPLEKSADPELFNVVEEMAIAAAVPCPAIYLIDDPSPNAFATGRDPQHAAIGITSGLRQKLTRDELQAVVAHEMAHIQNFDTRLMMLIAVFAGFVVIMADFFIRTARLSARSGRRSDDSAGAFGKAAPLAMLVLWSCAIVFALIAPIIAKFLQLAVSREREYLADATGVKFCRNPLALVSALEKISSDPNPLRRTNDALQPLFISNPRAARKPRLLNLDSAWSTHPPLRKRIARLRALAGPTNPV